MGMVWAATTHQGCVRSANEDAILAGPRIFAVADGVGGAAGGRDASTTTIAELVRADHAGPFDAEVLLSAIRSANAAIFARGSESQMGTTLAGIALCGEMDGQQQVVMFNIGDSRVYRMREGELSQLSVDHSVVAALVQAGKITAAEARDHPDRRVITRALGIEDEPDVDVAVFTPCVADRYLVCSDGLTNEVTDDEIAALLRSNRSASELAQALLERTLELGARDNVSVVVADVISVDSDGLAEAPTHRRSTLGRARRRRRAVQDDGTPR